MKIDTITLRNFRSLKAFHVDLQGQSAFFIGANGAGKSSLLRAINLVLARERAVTRFDFSDVAAPLEIEVRIIDLTDDEAAALKEAIDFGPPRTLKLRFRASWDADAEEATPELILPTKKNARSLSVTERDALAVLSLPAQRDPSRMLELGRRRTVLEQLIQNLALGQDLDRVAAAVDAAQRELGESTEITGLFAKVTANLRNLRPPEGVESLSVTPWARTPRELLAGLQVEYSQDGTSLPLPHQSAGLAQMISFCLSRASSGRSEGDDCRHRRARDVPPSTRPAIAYAPAGGHGVSGAARHTLCQPPRTGRRSPRVPPIQDRRRNRCSPSFHGDGQGRPTASAVHELAGC